MCIHEQASMALLAIMFAHHVASEVRDMIAIPGYAVQVSHFTNNSFDRYFYR
jgi:hypothetical protein